MDPLTLAASAASAIGLGSAWHLHRRACRAEAAAACLAKELRAERHAARHDPLTGLPNRRAFHRLGGTLVADTARHPLIAAVLDLDDFKQVNDVLGHAAGDEVLITVARRFATYAGSDLVARLGGDEFAGLLTSATVDVNRLAEAARELTEALAAPMRIAGHRVRVTVSVGLVPVPRGAQLAEALRQADAAMYRAKASGIAPILDGDVQRHPDIRPSAAARVTHRTIWLDREPANPPRQLVETTPHAETGRQ
jgi:diguanylate cyclase (GGDEF)-like protein